MILYDFSVLININYTLKRIQIGTGTGTQKGTDTE